LIVFVPWLGQLDGGAPLCHVESAFRRTIGQRGSAGFDRGCICPGRCRFSSPVGSRPPWSSTFSGGRFWCHSGFSPACRPN